MQITALFFASCRDITGRKELVVEVDEGASAGALKEELMARFPRLQGLAPVLSIAVNAEYAAEETLLCEGDEVAFIPPVSGG